VTQCILATDDPISISISIYLPRINENHTNKHWWVDQKELSSYRFGHPIHNGLNLNLRAWTKDTINSDSATWCKSKT
jgi:hypothetical protein